MRICFIVPSTEHSFRDPHIAVVSLATFINEKSMHNATIIDYSFHLKDWKEYIKKKIIQKQPEVIGITCTKLYMFEVLKIINLVKEEFNLPILLGGYHPTIMPEECINIKGVDAICIGDGEETIVEYLDAIKKGKDLSGIRGIWFKKKDKLVKNKGRQFYNKLNSLPFLNWDLYDEIKKHIKINEYLPFLENRGCASACTFCSAHKIKRIISGNYIRLVSPNRYVNSIEHQWNKYNRKFKFAITHDANFIVSNKWVSEFCNEYISRGLNELLFSIETRPDTINRERIRELKKAGCKLIRLGIESGSDYIRNTIFKKGLTKKQIFDAVKICKQEGISTIGYFILGAPGETYATMDDSLRMAKQLNQLGMDVTSFGTFKPVPGTDAYETLFNLGGKIHEDKWEDSFNVLCGGLVDTPFIKYNEVRRFHNKVLWKFRKEFLLKQIRKRNFGFFYKFPKYAYVAMKNGIKLSWLPFGWVTRLDNF